MAKHSANHGIELAQHNSPPNASTSNCGLYEWQHHDYNASVAPFVCYANWSFWVVVFRSSHPIHFIYFPFASFIFFSLSFFLPTKQCDLKVFWFFFSWTYHRFDVMRTIHTTHWKDYKRRSFYNAYIPSYRVTRERENVRHKKKMIKIKVRWSGINHG